MKATKQHKQHKHKPKHHPPEPERHLYTKTGEETRKEYGQYWALEKELTRKYKKQLRQGHTIGSLEECQKICNYLCEQLGVRRMPWVYHIPKDAWKETSYNSGKVIVLAERIISTRTVLHELAHYICFREGLKMRGCGSRGHSSDYLWVLELLWNTYFGKEM